MNPVCPVCKSLLSFSPSDSKRYWLAQCLNTECSVDHVRASGTFTSKNRRATRTIEWRRRHSENAMSRATGRRQTEESLVAELQKCAAELGRSPGAVMFDKWAGANRAQYYIIRFGSWRNACAAAGLKVNARPRGMGVRRIMDEDFIAAYTRIRNSIDRLPTCRDWMKLRHEDEPAEATVRRRFDNSWLKFVDWAEAMYQR